MRRILADLLSAQGIEGPAGPPGWGIHQLTADRAGPIRFGGPPLMSEPIPKVGNAQTQSAQPAAVRPAPARIPTVAWTIRTNH